MVLTWLDYVVIGGYLAAITAFGSYFARFQKTTRDYFLTDRVSVGGVFGYTHSPSMTGTTRLDFGARAGFNIDISGPVSIWPTAGVGAQWTSTNHTSSSSSALQIFAPFLYHPVQHPFVCIGPEFQAGLSGGDYTEYGVDFIIGGWLL